MLKFILSVLFLSSAAFGEKPLVVGSKVFSESIILAEMAAHLLESKGVTVVRKTNLGGTKVVFDALRFGDIDFYPDYTGTGYVMILKRKGEKDPEKVFKIVSEEFEKEYNLKWSKPLGFNNSYALAVRSDDNRFKEVERIGELSGKAKSLRLAAPHEFMERSDGYSPLVEQYELNFRPANVKSLDAGLMYSAIRDKQVDIIMSYSTDGRIGTYGLRLLEDDKRFFPPYQAAFLARKDALARRPELEEVFDELEGIIDEKTMAKLNDLVDRGNQDPGKVAKNFLIDRGLLEGQKAEPSSETSLWEYFLSKRMYLAKVVKEHLYLSFAALFLAVLVSLPLGIALSRMPNLARAVFPVINTIQTIPSLALLGLLIPFMGIGYVPAIIALFLYSLLPLVRNTHTGIEAVDPQNVEASRGIGLTDWQILWMVEIPLALPVILAGVRTASVIVIGTAALAALVGAGGLGEPIFRGVATVNGNLILLGAVPAALLAIFADRLLGYAETKLVSKGLRL